MLVIAKLIIHDDCSVFCIKEFEGYFRIRCVILNIQSLFNIRCHGYCHGYCAVSNFSITVLVSIRHRFVFYSSFLATAFLNCSVMYLGIYVAPLPGTR